MIKEYICEKLIHVINILYKKHIFMLKVALCSVVSPNGKCWWFNKININKIKELKTIIKSGIKVLLLYFNAIICTMVHLDVPFL